MCFSLLFIYTQCMSLAFAAYVHPSKVVIHPCKLMVYVNKSFNFFQGMNLTSVSVL